MLTNNGYFTILNPDVKLVAQMVAQTDILLFSFLDLWYNQISGHMTDGK